MTLSRIAICTDSSSLLSASAAASLGVELVSVAVALDGEPFDERMSSLDWFYERLRAGAAATTSQPSPGDFADAYHRAAARGAQSVVSIHLDARVSGTVSAAELAALTAVLPVRVVDTRTVSFGVGLCVRAAALAVATGAAAGDAARAASRLGGVLRNAFVARGGPGGRVPTAAGWTLLTYANGAASRISQPSSLADGIDEIVSHVVSSDTPISAAVGHASREMEAAADELAHRLLAAEGVATVERYRVGASVGAHTGPDSFGAFWWPAT
jgi:fatty acid-binding protein DegV